MTRDGIKKLPVWGKPKRDGCVTFRAKLVMPPCAEPGCAKRAGYETPIGHRCFTHAIALRDTGAAS
jgi:hypothetical protein